MKYVIENNIYKFDFWAGAKQTIKTLVDAGLDLDTLEELIMESYIYVIPTKTDINYFVWFETEIIAERYGFNNFDEIIKIADKKKERVKK